jgi:hypothetical protein
LGIAARGKPGMTRGETATRVRRHGGVAIALVLAAVSSLAAACGPERGIDGVTVTVQNATHAPLVVAVRSVQWSVPADSTRLLTGITGVVPGTGTVAVSLFDAGTCALLGVETLHFAEDSMDQTVVVPAEGAITARPLQSREAVAWATAAPSRCAGGAP